MSNKNQISPIMYSLMLEPSAQQRLVDAGHCVVGNWHWNRGIDYILVLINDIRHIRFCIQDTVLAINVCTNVLYPGLCFNHFNGDSRFYYFYLGHNLV